MMGSNANAIKQLLFMICLIINKLIFKHVKINRFLNL